jgi:hypothetical protein
MDRVLRQLKLLRVLVAVNLALTIIGLIFVLRIYGEIGHFAD